MSEKLLKENDWRRTADCLAKDENLVAAWVFGSAREGIVRPGADIDIGVFFVRKPSIDELADLRTALQDSLSFDEIDLVVLNEASPILRFEAVSGRSVYTADMETRATLCGGVWRFSERRFIEL